MQPTVNQRCCAEHPALERPTVTVTREWGWGRALAAGIQMDTEHVETQRRWRSQGGFLQEEVSSTGVRGCSRDQSNSRFLPCTRDSRVGSCRGRGPAGSRTFP